MIALLQAAGVYNVVWALAAIVWPAMVLGLIEISDPVAELVMRALGVVIGVLGLGFLASSTDPFRHWPVVLMGFLGKTGSAIGMSFLILSGTIPSGAWKWVAINDVIWVAPFGLILHSAYESLLGRKRCNAPDVLKLAFRRKTQDGMTLDELSRLSPVLLVFLRHAGCTFCREALADLAAKRHEIEQAGARVVLVHMGTEEHGAKFFARYGLENAQRISDPERALYRAFGLPRGSFGDLFGPKVWIRGFEAGILGRHGVGKLVGDGFQMPGAFLLYYGEILRSYRHQSAADRPDYLALVTGREYAAPELRGT